MQKINIIEQSNYKNDALFKKYTSKIGLIKNQKIAFIKEYYENKNIKIADKLHKFSKHSQLLVDKINRKEKNKLKKIRIKFQNFENSFQNFKISENEYKTQKEVLIKSVNKEKQNIKEKYDHIRNEIISSRKQKEINLTLKFKNKREKNNQNAIKKTENIKKIAEERINKINKNKLSSIFLNRKNKYIEKINTVNTKSQNKINIINNKVKAKELGLIVAQKQIKRIESKFNGKTQLLNKNLFSKENIYEVKENKISYYKFYFNSDFLDNFKNTILNIWKHYKLLLITLIISLIIGAMYDNFFSKANIIDNIIISSIPLAFMGLGYTFIMISGGMDLSGGSVLGFSAAIIGSFIIAGMNPWIAAIVGILVGLSIGVFSGMFSTILRVNAFIVTLVASLVFQGGRRLATGGVDHAMFKIQKTLSPLADTTFFGLPILMWIFILFALTCAYFLKYSRTGRRIYAIGSNREAARVSGIRVTILSVMAFALSSGFSAFGGVAYLSLYNAYGPNTGTALEFDAITAAILGGTSLFGGVGSIGRTLQGIFVLQLVSNALTFMGINPDYQYIIKGIILLLAITLDSQFDFKAYIKKIKMIVRRLHA